MYLLSLLASRGGTAKLMYRDKLYSILWKNWIPKESDNDVGYSIYSDSRIINYWVISKVECGKKISNCFKQHEMLVKDSPLVTNFTSTEHEK